MKHFILGTLLFFGPCAFASDPCFESNVVPGTKCDGGSVFAGSFNGRNYMTTEVNGRTTTWGAYNQHSGVIDPENGTENTRKLANISSPAEYCYDLQTGGYSDWFLPAERELMMILRNASQIGGFGSDWYWSSTESPPYNGFKPMFVRGSSISLGRPTNLSKDWECITRCVRIAGSF